MNDKPLVSIIINNYNYKNFLTKAIDSALNQTYQNIEVIVVDDGSTDGSQDLIVSYGDLVVPCFKENGGQPTAMNVGVAASKGDIICLLDSDDSFEQEKVEEVVNIFCSHPEIGWCFHSLILRDQDNYQPMAISRVFPGQERNLSQTCDFRDKLRRGRLNFYAPATSGLSFTKSNLERVFPLPEFLGNSSDRYIAYASMSIDKGYFLAKELSTQLIHGNNNITHQENELSSCRRALYAIIVSYGLQFNFSEIKWFNHRSFSRGLAMSWQYGLPSNDGQAFINDYFSSIPINERAIILLITIFRFLFLKLNSRRDSFFYPPVPSQV